MPAVGEQDRLATLHERDLSKFVSSYQLPLIERRSTEGEDEGSTAHLQLKVLQNLDQGRFEARNLQSVLDSPNEANGVNLGADVLEETADEACKGVVS